MFEKAAADFILAPDDTSFLFVVTYMHSAPWFHFTRAYHVVHIHRKADSARMFSRLCAGTYRPAALTDAGDEGGPGRVFIQECPYDFMILYRNKGTPIRMDDYVAAYLRFGHYGSQHISKLVTSGVNTGLQLSQSTLVACSPMCDCRACSLTKARAPNRGGPKDPERRRASANFSHVATDICGPISPTSSGGLRYLMTFTCLRSRWRSVHYLETKDEALLALQGFLIFVKKVTDVSVALVIRSDNESVFVQGKFRAFCNLHGITQETCAPYQHWGNGHAESSFNVMFAAARPMMFTSGFNHTHWPLATSHSVWLQNRLPNKGNGWRIPYDEVFGKLPDLSFVRVFGSQAYAFVDPSLRKKLAPRAKDMLYVGHQEHGSHYMLLDTTNNKVYLTGKPVIRERFDEIGRRLASDGPTLQELVVFENGERKQPSPFAVEMPPAFCESAISLCLW
jgi:hypothetical protein